MLLLSVQGKTNLIFSKNSEKKPVYSITYEITNNIKTT